MLLEPSVAKKVRCSTICTGSVASSFGANGPVPYTMSKHAVLGLVRSATGELGKHGIRFSCVSPVGVATPLACIVHKQEPREVEMVRASMSGLKGIILKAKIVEEAALFLGRDESACISGHNLVVDGGASVVNTALAMMLDGLNIH